MAANDKHRCNGLFAFRVLDTVALVIAVVLQGLAFNNFFTVHADEKSEFKLFYLLYVADALVVIIVIVASIVSYRNLLDRLHNRLINIDIPHVDVPMYGVLPFGYITWALYAMLITTKLALFFDKHLQNFMTSNGTDDGLLSSSIFKVILAGSSVVFVLLVNTHHDAEPQSVRSSYIADLCKSTTFDIMDSVAFLTILLPEYGLPDSYQTRLLHNSVLVLASINLFLPTLALMKLSLSDFCQAGHPFRLELLYKTGRFILIDLPYMSVRIYLWQVDRSVSLFLVKNVLYVLISLRYLLPEYIAVIRHGRRVGASQVSLMSEKIGQERTDGDADENGQAPNTISSGVL